MTLAIDWPHDPVDPGSDHPRPGPMTLAIRWPHDPGENVGPWPHVPGDRQFFCPSANSIETRPRPLRPDAAAQLQCEEEDLNLHSFRNQILSLARLPVPPSSRKTILNIYGFAASASTSRVATT
jgi:hypothetical protein